MTSSPSTSSCFLLSFDFSDSSAPPRAHVIAATRIVMGPPLFSLYSSTCGRYVYNHHTTAGMRSLTVDNQSDVFEVGQHIDWLDG